MVDAELATLASSGAGTLVSLMVTDAWSEVREKFAAMLGRRRGDAEAVAGELETVRAELAEAGPQGYPDAASALLTEWQARLRRMLREDPETAPLLARLLEQYAPRIEPTAARTEIQINTANGAPVFAAMGGGNVINHYHTAGRRLPDPPELGIEPEQSR